MAPARRVDPGDRWTDHCRDDAWRFWQPKIHDQSSLGRTEEVMSAENKALVRRWFQEVWNEGRAASIDELLDPHGVVHGLGGDMRGPAAFKPFHAAYRDAFPDVRIQIEDMVAEGDKVAFRWSATATHRGNGLRIPATNRAVRFEGMGIIRIENGHLVEGWNTFDQLGMFQQLGVVNLPA
jgi:steroid delta-isomerase-like uncharacterized protein